jgi:hypothetical protein
MTTGLRNVAKSSLRERVSADEWDVRVNLAACYRLAAHFRMTDLIYTHISARVPDADQRAGGRREAADSLSGSSGKSSRPVRGAALQGEAAGVESAPAHARQDGSVLQELTA